MKFRCRSCQTVVSAREELAGKVVACPSCKTKLRVPGGAPAENAAPTAIQPAKARVPAPKPREQFDDVEVLDTPKKKPNTPKRRRRATSSSLHYLVAAGAGVGIALVIVVIGVVWMNASSLRGPLRQPVVVAQAPKVDVPPLVAKVPKNRVNPPIVEPDDDPDPVPEPPRPKPKKNVIVIPVERPQPDPPAEITINAIPSEFKIPLADEAKQEERAKDLLAHNRRTTVEAYDKVGKKDPAWDAAARETLETIAKLFAEKQSTTFQPLLPMAQKAIDAGCDDPLILYLHARASKDAGEDAGDLLVTAGKALAKSDYPAFRRAVGIQHAAWAMVEQSDGEIEKIREADEMLDAALAMIVKSRKIDDPHTDVKRLWFEVPQRIAIAHLRLGRPVPDVLTRVDAILKKSPEMDAYRLHLRGEFMTAYAWQARGGGLANTVTKDGWAKFHQRLADARLSYEQSWEKEPDSRVAGSLITILKGSGNRADAGVKANVKTWFDRAMKANPDDIGAVTQVMDYLDPRWHGSEGQVVGFGHACRDSKNWRAGITLMLAEAHYRAVALQERDTISRYMRSNTVWNEIHAVYDDYFDHRPNDKAEHFRFAVYCFLCEKNDHAQKHFQLAEGTVAPMFVPLELTLQIRDSIMR